MGEVRVSDGALHIALTVPERVFSLHSGTVEVQLDEIRGVRVVRNVLGQLRGVPMPGSRMPGRAAIGTWRSTVDGRAVRDFVLIRRAGPGLLITTAGPYDRLLIGTDEPEQLAAELTASDDPRPTG